MALLSVHRAAAASVRPSAAVSLRSALPATRPARAGQAQRRTARASVVVRAAESEDFDAVLNKFAEKFEKAENKPVVIGYVAAAAAAILTAEWFIHLPVLNALLGFPIQLVGLLSLPILGVRWFVDGEDAGKDIEAAAGKIISKLPGLEKK